MTDLSPLQLGDISLKNRMIMAPLTRSRAGESRIPNDMMAQYYAQRASAGLIITEATAISPQGYGWHGAPAIYADSHVDGWKKTTKAVHDKGGKIVLQLWHMGRVSHPDFPERQSPCRAICHRRRRHGKYAKWQEALFEIPKYVLAARMGFTPETLSRIFRELSDAGMIHVHGKLVTLLEAFAHAPGARPLPVTGRALTPSCARRAVGSGWFSSHGAGRTAGLAAQPA